MKLEIITRKAKNKSSEIPMLMVHGGAGGAWYFDHYQTYFSNLGFDTYAVSLRAHGQSEGHDVNTYGLEDYREDVIQTLLEFKCKAFVIGHSMGAAVVLKALEKRPDLFFHTLLLSPPPIWGIDETSPLGLFFDDTMSFVREMRKNPVYQGLNLESLLRKTMFNDHISLEELTKIRKKLCKESKKVKLELLKPYLTDVKDLMNQVSIIGSDEDALVNAHDLTKMGELLGTKPIMLKGLPHFMMLDPNWEISAITINEVIHQINFKYFGSRNMN